MIGLEETTPTPGVPEVSLAKRIESLAQSARTLAVRTEMSVRRAMSNEAQPKDIAFEGEARSEVLANLRLAIRHLEDAESRLQRAWKNTNHGS